MTRLLKGLVLRAVLKYDSSDLVVYPEDNCTSDRKEAVVRGLRESWVNSVSCGERGVRRGSVKCRGFHTSVFSLCCVLSDVVSIGSIISS